MVDQLTVVGVQKTIKELNIGKAQGLDDILVKILLHEQAVEIHHLISDVWSDAHVLQQRVDTILISKGRDINLNLEITLVSFCNICLGRFCKTFARLVNKMDIFLCYPGKSMF